LRREWIETYLKKNAAAPDPGLPSCEGSGLKHYSCTALLLKQSLPSCEGSGLKRVNFKGKFFVAGLPSCEGSGLKQKFPDFIAAPDGLPSCEGSGLKRIRWLLVTWFVMSPFLRREWIETQWTFCLRYSYRVSLLAKGVDWNISWNPAMVVGIRLPSCEGSGLKHLIPYYTTGIDGSPFLRREWIETNKPSIFCAREWGLPSCEGSGLKHV